MKVGDLVHNPQYPFWGVGIVLKMDEHVSAYIRWVDGECCWRYRIDLEVL